MFVQIVQAKDRAKQAEDILKSLLEFNGLQFKDVLEEHYLKNSEKYRNWEEIQDSIEPGLRAQIFRELYLNNARYFAYKIRCWSEEFERRVAKGDQRLLSETILIELKTNWNLSKQYAPPALLIRVEAYLARIDECGYVKCVVNSCKFSSSKRVASDVFLQKYTDICLPMRRNWKKDHSESARTLFDLNATKWPKEFYVCEQLVFKHPKDRPKRSSWFPW